MSNGGPIVPDSNLPSNEVQLLRYIASYLAQIQTNTGSAGGEPTQPVGAANQANGQFTAGGSQGQIVGARATRSGVTFINTDASNTVFIGPSGVTAGTGLPIPAGSSITVTWTGAIYGICSSGTPVLGYWDEYNWFPVLTP
jgi:hypothetical protein